PAPSTTALSLHDALPTSSSPVGPPHEWPQSLRTSLSILLDSRYPMYIAWGPEFTQFYNDAYRPILGAVKHPAALGRSTRETFSEDRKSTRLNSSHVKISY